MALKPYDYLCKVICTQALLIIQSTTCNEEEMRQGCLMIFGECVLNFLTSIGRYICLLSISGTMDTNNLSANLKTLHHNSYSIRLHKP